MRGAGIFPYGLVLSAGFAAASATSALAQSTPAPATSSDLENPATMEEVVVTARKRSETQIAVPVAITALGETELNRYGTHDLTGLAAQVPGLIIQPIPGGAGGSIALRGVTSTPSNPAVDQAVSFNIDGVQVGSGNILRMGQIDLQQVEILKGPQALFFGKNSPGGIISLRSVDPADHLQMKAVVSDEVNADEQNGLLAVSGPITEKLGARVVGSVSRMSGYRFNDSPTNPAAFEFGPARRHDPKRSEEFVRGTVVYKPFAELSIRAKYNYDHVRAADPWVTAERIACPYGTPQTGAGGAAAAVDDCKANGHFYQGDIDPRVTRALPGFFPFDGTHTTQQLASLEANYELAPDIILTSVTGYYDMHDAFYGPSVYQPVSLLISGTDTRRRDTSEELRLATSRADWPVNFTLGGYYQDSSFYNGIPLVFTAPLQPVSFTRGNNFNQFYIKTEAYSVFGQGIWKIIDALELAGGARYSVEKKHLNFFQTTGQPTALVRNEIVTGKPTLRFTDVSPEVTLTYRPTRTLTVFTAFRNGFKSGNFNTGGGGAAGLDLTYRPEDVRGVEAGIKSIIDRTLRINATVYSYLYRNLQVSTFDPNTARQTVINAASARIQGLETDASWSTPLTGLELHGSLNYNHARYKSFLVGCYNGETIAAGCNLNANPATGAFRQQDFRNRQLTLAPNWTSAIGFNYETGIWSDLRFGVSGDASYSSPFWAQLEQAPLGQQPSSWMFDASARLGPENGPWELALIGRNLTEVYRSRFVSQVPGTGIGARTGTALSGGLSDLSGQVNRGREVQLQLTVKID